MHTTRKLTLKRERLAELSNDQLDGLAGGLAGVAVQIKGVTDEPLTYQTMCPVTYRTGCPTCSQVFVA